jgi:hypothetical protein
MLIKKICPFVNIFHVLLATQNIYLTIFIFFFHDMQRLLKVSSPISPNIQHSDVFGTQDSTTTKVFKKEKKNLNEI